MKAMRSMLVVPLAGLAACSMMPKYVRPDAPVPPALPQGAAYPALGAGDKQVDALGWKDFFTDPRLQQVIGLAIAQNRDLRVTLANVEQARAQYRVQRAGQFPTITGGAGATVSHSAVNNGGLVGGGGNGGIGGGGNGAGNFEQYSITGNLAAFEIDLFGRRAALSRAAFESYLATDEGRKATQIALVGEVATAWLTHAATADALAVAQDTLKSRQATLSISLKREREGIGTGLEVAQAQTQVDSARADVADFTTSLAQAKNALDLLAGAPVPVELLPTTLGAGDQLRLQLPVGLDSAVLLRRPDVLQAEHQLLSANANVGAARAAMFPTISLTGLLGLASTGLSNLFDGGSFRWSATGAATQTLFDGGARANTLKGAKAARDAAVANYEGAIQAAFRDVADALARRGTIDAKLAAQQSLVDNAVKASRISQSRFTAGIASYLEPLDAQRTAYAARQALVAARLQRATNMVTLYRVLGGGLTP
ncbi:efflux transporter outer membrane subunit [Novosphingobium cyanobacteriorum]|uniref:Efflux transporter outer membrane subunit n=1 Tax=Novosphingobium cyanobacteriorum TaxID=3024215 RepID=A0ABT6CG13_9SPHN|nr:efflux transporter outer membrane subunit [Novosphingobium cyanobacteriorum]MDF8332449.1 efflux transporter outer membrane subunit [Novosphingobium cyanobacteriorum]